MSIPGITEKKLKNGEKAIMVRFKYLSKKYAPRNFTKLYGCTTATQARDKLNEIKILLSKGLDPFNTQTKNLDYYFDETYKNMILNKKWKVGSTARSYLNFYNRNVRKQIGWKKLSKITYANLMEIVETFTLEQGSNRNMLKKLVNPIFKEALKHNEISKNVVDQIKHYSVSSKEDLNKRVKDDTLTTIKKLYIGIGKYKPKVKLTQELNAYLYLLVLSAHRYGELLKLTKEDIDMEDNIIVSPANITKTKVSYHYPLPFECREYFSSVDSGLLFPNLRYSSVADYFSKLVKLSEIRLFNNKKITPHDTRVLLINIMIKKCNVDSILADYCIDHKQTTAIKDYLDFDFNDKKDAYTKYWSLIR